MPIRQKSAELLAGDRWLINWNAQQHDDKYYPQPPSRSYTEDGETIYWTDEQYEAFSREAGSILRDRVDKAVEQGKLNPDFPGEGELKLFRKLMSQSREEAKKYVQQL